MAGTPIYTIEPNPHWVIIDAFSKLPNGAAIYTYSSLNPSTFKPAFQDGAGNIPYGQPIVGFGNGTMPPIFWEFDPNNPTDTYYIRVYDSADTTTQQFLWDFNGLSGGGSGGGGTVVTAFDIENLVINGVFYRNIGNQAGTPSLPTLLTVAPSNNAGFVGDAINSGGSPAPDIIFAKNNTTASDQLNFVTFSPLGIHALTGDVTPSQYLNYQCTGAGAAETYKYVQFPISQGVQNLSAQSATVKIYARCNSGTPTITLTWRQFYGSGGSPSADQLLLVTPTIALTSDWAVYSFNSIIPDASGKTLGACGNDGLFLQVGFPLSPDTTNIDFVKPAIYLGSIAPGLDYHSNDMIDSIINSPRTGDIRTSLNDFLPGWVNMNDGTIGSASSASTSRANIDTFPLFNLIWNTFQASQAFAPMFTSAGVASPYGASAIVDFASNRRLSLTRNLGRVMAGALPAQVTQAFTNVGNIITVTSTASFYTGVPVTITGGALPSPLLVGVTYYAIQLSATTMSLAISAENAIAGTALALTTNAGGNVIVSANALGSFVGEYGHVLTISEMPNHAHTIPGLAQNYCAAGAANTYNTTGPPGNTNTSLVGGGLAHNNIQPTVFMNVFIKL